MKLRTSTTLILALLAALVVSNLWWLYQAIDLSTYRKYEQQELYETTHALSAVQRVLPPLAEGLSKGEIVSQVRETLEVPSDEVFEKEGWVVVGWVELRFDDSEKLVEVGPSFGKWLPESQ